MGWGRQAGARLADGVGQRGIRGHCHPLQGGLQEGGMAYPDRAAAPRWQTGQLHDSGVVQWHAKAAELLCRALPAQVRAPHLL